MGCYESGIFYITLSAAIYNGVLSIVILVKVQYYHQVQLFTSEYEENIINNYILSFPFCVDNIHLFTYLPNIESIEGFCFPQKLRPNVYYYNNNLDLITFYKK